MVAATEAQCQPKVQSNRNASHAIPSGNGTVAVKRGRKPVVTPERVQMICGALARGGSVNTESLDESDPLRPVLT